MKANRIKCPACGRFTRACEPVDECGMQRRECVCGWIAEVDGLTPASVDERESRQRRLTDRPADEAVRP